VLWIKALVKLGVLNDDYSIEINASLYYFTLSLLINYPFNEIF
jgi:hypothetical protein